MVSASEKHSKSFQTPNPLTAHISARTCLWRLTAAEIVANYSSAYGSWTKTIEIFKKSPSIDNNMDILRKDAPNFHHPIVLDSENRKVTEGHHRVVAALQTCPDYLLWVSDQPSDLDDYAMAKFKGETLSRETIDSISSFPVTNGWVNTVCDGNRDQTITICLEYSKHQKGAWKLEAIQALEQKLGQKLHVIKPS